MSRNGGSQPLGRRHHRLSVFSTDTITAVVMAVLAVAGLCLWHVAIALTTDVPFSEPSATYRALLRFEPFAGLPPAMRPASGLPTVLVWLLLFGTTFAAVGVLLARAWTRRGAAVGLASGAETRQSAGERRARNAAAQSRAASIGAGHLDPATCPLAEVGLRIGRAADTGEPVIVTLEDQVGIMGPTGAGKSVYFGVGAALDAPGPLVATSTKAELLDAITEARSARGRVFVFDPLDLAQWPQRMVWDPTAGAEDSATAIARGEAFTGAFAQDTDGDANNPFFQRAAGIIIARLLHAAALGGKTMRDVIEWAVLMDRSTVAHEILRHHGEAEVLWARTLETAMQGADETISSVRMTLAQKVEPLLSGRVLDQLVRRDDVESFDPNGFVTSHDTLLIITDDNARTNVAPLAAMLLGEINDAAKYAAARSMVGRLDPPLRIMGDEIPNVAPVPKLPRQLSDSRGSGTQWIVVFQSLAQMRSRWGREGAEQILANLNVIVVLGGLQDDDALERFSRLVGSVDVAQISANLTAQRTSSGHSISTTERRVLRPEEIRQIAAGQALVLYRSAPAMLVDLEPWFNRPDAHLITAAIDHTRMMRIRQASG